MARVNVGRPEANASGLWRASVWPGRLEHLVHALDPDHSFVVIESHVVVGWVWSKLPVPIHSHDRAITQRTVRRVRIDLLLSPQECVAAAAELDAGEDGRAFIWQLEKRPPDNLSLLDKKHGSWSPIFEEVGIDLAIDLPHRDEMAMLTARTEERLAAALSRLPR